MNNPDNYPLQSYLQTLLQSFEQIMLKSGSDYTQLLSMMNARTGRAAQMFWVPFRSCSSIRFTEVFYEGFGTW